MGDQGLFLVFEGVEGSGKSTQAALLGKWLEARGIDHIVTREPGGTEIGEQIRALVLESEALPARSELLLLLSARSIFVEEVVRPALAAGRVVIADRYELSTFAYQGYGRGLALGAVRAMNEFATGGLRPDLTLLLDVPVVVGGARRASAGRAPDRIEREASGFHDRVGEAYRLLAVTEPGVERIDGTGSPEEVHREVLRRLALHFPETFPPGAG